MAEAKPLASLSAGLLARKGTARPAMRRQAALPGVPAGVHGHDDLGWNDMGYDVDPQMSPVEAPRTMPHGLSPMMASGDASQGNDDAMDAFTAAVERAMVDPAPTTPATVAPIHDDTPLPTQEEPPLVVRQRAQIAAAVEDKRIMVTPQAGESPAAIAPKASKPAPRVRAGTRGSYAFTLRLDPDRHLRLRLASATSNRSSQQILIALVDEYLSTIPEIDAFAARLPANATR